MNNLASVYAQEEITDETGNPTDAITIEEAVDDIQTLQDTLDITEDENTEVKLNFFQILVAILAPLTFLTIGYLLIKKLKL